MMFLNNFVDGRQRARQPEIRERVEPNPRPINPTPKPTAELIPLELPIYPPTPGPTRGPQDERVEPNPRPINPTPKPTAELIPKDHYPPTYPPTDPR